VSREFDDHRVALTARHPVIAGILLAAGRSTRMGRPKQLLDWHGVPLVRHVAAIALQSSLQELLIVTGSESGRVRAALSGIPARIVQNDSFDAGQSSSLRAGIAALGPEVAAAIVLLVDQPLLQPATIDALIAAWQPPCRIVAPRFAGRRGNPVLFDRALFGEIAAISGDRGARDVIRAHESALCLVDVDDAGVAADLDTPDDYRRLSGAGRIGDE
jgi:molybdenum cofactor cytidylyltransferase